MESRGFSNRITGGPFTMAPLSVSAIATSLVYGVSAGAVTNNSPSAGYVAWAGVKIQYGGTEYTITDGNTNSLWIIWDSGSPTTLAGAADLTGLTNAKFIFGMNSTGLFLSSYVSTLQAGAIIGQLTNAQLAAIAAAKITGTIVGTQIADGAITTAKIYAGSVTTNEIAANTIVAANIAALTITAAQIAASTITAAKMNVTQLSAIAADLGTVTAGTLIGTTIKTVASGARILINDGDNKLRVNNGGTDIIIMDPYSSNPCMTVGGNITLIGFMGDNGVAGTWYVGGTGGYGYFTHLTISTAIGSSFNCNCDITMGSGKKVDGVDISAETVQVNITNTLGASGIIDASANNAAIKFRYLSGFNGNTALPTMGTGGEAIMAFNSDDGKWYWIYKLDASNYFKVEMAHVTATPF